MKRDKELLSETACIAAVGAMIAGLSYASGTTFGVVVGLLIFVPCVAVCVFLIRCIFADATKEEGK